LRQQAFNAFDLAVRWGLSVLIVIGTWPVDAHEQAAPNAYPASTESTLHQQSTLVHLAPGVAEVTAYGMTVRRHSLPPMASLNTDVSVLVSCELADDRNMDSKVLNVTKECAAYSVLSRDPVTIEVPFDSSILPEDISPSEVQLFRVDFASATIKPMDAFVDIENKKTIATLNDRVGRFFNGVLKSGERPERPPASFSTDSLKQLNSANPIAGIPMISAPSPSQTGELKLQFPIDLPAANRGELKPNFLVSYVSGSGYGNLGEGWSLTVPTISIETRWGVPVFDPKYETETYLFNGEQLVPEAGDFLPDAASATLPPAASDSSTADIRAATLELVPQPHRTAKLRPRKTGKAQFVVRRDEGLWRFNRYGDDPAQYWWEAWQENGQSQTVKVMYFGKAPGLLSNDLAGDLGSTNSVETQAVLRTGPLSVTATPDSIVRWGLARELDAFGNIIDYDWHNKCEIGPAKCKGPDTTANLTANDLYLKRITYYGHRDLEETILRCREARQQLAGCTRDLGLYEVLFSWKTGGFQRMDGRAGGMMKSGDLLNAIDVRFRNKSGDITASVWTCSQSFVRYNFTYTADPLYGGDAAAKQRLAAITKSVSEDDTGSTATVSLASNTTLFPTARLDCSVPDSDAPLDGAKATTRFSYNNRQFVGSADGHSEHFALASSQPIDVDLGSRLNTLHDLFGLGTQGPFNASLLGSAATSEATGGLYAGVAFVSPEKSFSAGFRYSFASRDNYLDSTLLVDVTGDGIPDLIVRGRDGYSIYAGTLNGAGVLTFRGNPIQKDLPDNFAFQKEPTHYWDSWSVEAHPFSLFFGISGGSSSTIQTNYLVDMDGDGRPDAVAPGAVLFNSSNTGAAPTDGKVTFNDQSPYIDGLVKDLNPIPNAISVADDLSKGVKIPQSHDHPRYDTVRYWKAPFDGEIIIKGKPVLLPQPANGDQPYGNQDGVIVSIERGRAGDPRTKICESYKLTQQSGWSTEFQSECFEGSLDALKNMLGSFDGAAVTVRQNDVISFRVNSIDNGSMDVVAWDPVIDYVKATDPTIDATGALSSRLFLDYAQTGAGPDQPTQGLPLVLASLRTEGTDCASVNTKDTTGSNWPVGESDVGLCDPWGRSVIRYAATPEAIPQATTLGAWSAPKTGKVNFAGSLFKPQTSARVRLTYQLIDSPKDQKELNDAKRQGNTSFSCDPTHSTTPLHIERLIEPTSTWVPAAWMERDSGRYRLSADSSFKTELFVKEGQLLCVYLQSALPASADDLQNLFAGTYGFWPEDGSRWKWTKSLAGGGEKTDPFTISYLAVKEVIEQRVTDSGTIVDASTVAVPKGKELDLSECFTGDAPKIYSDAAFDKLSADERAKFVAEHPARLACRESTEEYFLMPRIGAAVGSTISFGASTGTPARAIRIERRQTEFRLAPDARSDSSVLQCWAEPGGPPLREYRFRLRENIIAPIASSSTLGPTVAQIRTSAYIRNETGLMPVPLTPLSVVNANLKKTVPITLNHLLGRLTAGEQTVADTRVAGEAVLQQVHLRVGPAGRRLAGTAFVSSFRFPKLSAFDTSSLPQISDEADIAYAVCAPEAGAQIVLETAIEDAGPVGGIDYAAAEGLSGEQPCAEAPSPPMPTDPDRERRRICPLGAAVVEFPGHASAAAAATPLILLADNLVFYNQRTEALWPEGLRGWGGMAVRYEDQLMTPGVVAPPIPSQASDLNPLPTFDELRKQNSQFNNQMQGTGDALQNGTSPCQLKPDVAGNEDKCKTLSDKSGGTAAVPVYPLIAQYRVAKAINENSPNTPDRREACQFNPRRNYPISANLRAQLKVPAALQTTGRTATLLSNDNTQIGSASEVMLDPNMCSMGPDNAIWISDDLMSASRIGLKDLHVGVEKELSNVHAQIASPTASGLRGIAKVSSANVSSEAASFALPGGISHSSTDTTTKTEVLDLNGDGFPDLIIDGNIYFTGPGGYFRCGANSPWNGDRTCSGSALPTSDVVRQTKGNTYGGSISIGSPPHTYPKDTNGGRANLGGSAAGMTLNEPSKEKDPSFANFGLTASLNKGASNRRRDFVDMNGDGLPDLVEGADCIDPLKDGEPNPCSVKVWLNLGYGFSAHSVDWLNSRGVFGDRSASTGFGISAGYSNSENDGAYQGGISANLNTSRQDRVLLDVNGDGLPDLVYIAGNEIKAFMNTGTGFSANPVAIGTIPAGLNPVGPGRTEADATSAGGAFAYFIPIWWLPPIYIVINPNVSVSDSVTRQPVAFRDVDGDGLPDLVVGEGLGNGSGGLGFRNDSAEVVPNNLGAHGLLSGVFLPTNTSDSPNFGFEFRRTLPSDRDPVSRWALSSISTNRGFSAADAAGESERTTCISYGDSLYERFERRFLGFGRIEVIEGCRIKPNKSRSLIEIAGDPTWNDALDGIRKIVRRYANGTVYESGLLLSEEIYDLTADSTASKTPMRVIRNRYVLVDTALSSAAQVVCHKLRTGRTDVLDTGLISVDRLPAHCRDDLRPQNDDLQRPLFDRSARRLTPALVQTVRLTREADSNPDNPLRTAAQFQLDQFGRPEQVCDLGDLSGSGIDDEPKAEPPSGLIAVTTLRAPVCSKLRYETMVRPVFPHGATGGGTLLVEQRNLVREAGIYSFANNAATRTEGGPTATEQEITFESTDAVPLTISKSRVMERRRTAAYDLRTGARTALCSFVNVGAPDPCSTSSSYPARGASMIVASQSGVVKNSYAYDAFGNLLRYVGPVGSRRTFVAKTYRYDSYLNIVEAGEQTDYCRLNDDGDPNTPDPLFPPDAPCLDGVSEIGGMISRSIVVDYRHAVPTVAIDPNHNLLLTLLDGFGRPKAVYSSWNSTGSTCNTQVCPDLSKAPFDTYLAGKFAGADVALRQLVHFANRLNGDGGHSVGPTAIVELYVPANLYIAADSFNVSNGVLSLPSKHLFDQLGQPLQTISPAAVCEPGGEAWNPAGCATTAAFVATGAILQDRLFRSVQEFLPQGLAGKTATDIDTLGYTIDGAGPSTTPSFDAFDRTLSIKLPDKNSYQFEFTIATEASEAGPRLRHRTIARDSLCVPSIVDRDVRGNIRTVAEIFAPGADKTGLGSSPQSGEVRVGSNERVASIDAADGAQQVYTCNDNVAIDKGVASVTAYEFDSLNQLVSVQLPNRTAAPSVTVARPSTAAIQIGYDHLGRRLLINDPDRGFEYLSYDAASNVVCDRYGPQRDKVLISELPPLDWSAEIAGPSAGPICRIPDESEQARITRVIQSSYIGPLIAQTRYVWPTQLSTARGFVVRYGASSDVDVFKQNILGRMSAVEDNAGKAFFGYDALGLPAKTSRALRQDLSELVSGKSYHVTTTYERDAWGTLAKTSIVADIPAFRGTADDALSVSREVSEIYTVTGQLQSVSIAKPGASPIPILKDVKYDARGNVVRAQYENGVTIENRYDAASNRLLASSSQIGVGCNDTGATIDCVRGPPPILFQNLTYRYDAAGNVLAYANKPRYRADCREISIGDACEKISPDDARLWGLLIAGSDNSFRYDELNRIRSASKKITAFDRAANIDPLTKRALKAASPFELGFEETFSLLADHTFNRIQRTEQRRQLGSTNIRNNSLSLVFAYSDNQNYPRHAPLTVSRLAKSESAIAENFTIAMGFDERGRMTASVCDKQPLCAGDQLERRYFWYPEDTLHETLVGKPNPEFTKADKRAVAWYDRVESEYGYDGQRLYRVRNEEGWTTPATKANNINTRVADTRVADTLYLDPLLTVTRRGNGRPQALLHLFAGSARLASVWLPDKDGDDTQEFAYHTQLQTRNISDVVRSTLGKPQTARLHQQIEYAAFGEILAERERSLEENLVAFPNGEKRALTSREEAGLPHYRFNGKEEDETGVTDFGTRSYDGRLSMWLRPDPAFGAYLRGSPNGGVYLSKNLASYQFAGQNPIANIDVGGSYACAGIDCGTAFDANSEAMFAGVSTKRTGNSSDGIYHLFDAPTPLPPGHTVQANLEFLAVPKQLSPRISVAMIQMAAPTIGGIIRMAPRELGGYQMPWAVGLWDYKRTSGPEWDDAGNYNYGFISAGLHIPEWAAVEVAGIAKALTGSYDPSYGHFYNFGESSTHGISAPNLREIRKGYEYYRYGELVDWLYSRPPQPLTIQPPD
jgi:RHS repeat-associated protein